MMTSTVLFLAGAAIVAPVLVSRSGFFSREALIFMAAASLVANAAGCIAWAVEAGMLPAVALRIGLLVLIVAALFGGLVAARHSV